MVSVLSVVSVVSAVSIVSFCPLCYVMRFTGGIRYVPFSTSGRG